MRVVVDMKLLLDNRKCIRHV